MERLKIYMAPLQGLTEAPYRNAFEEALRWSGCVLHTFHPLGARCPEKERMYVICIRMQTK